MADDNVDWRFLGRQVQNLQGDVRDLRAAHLRLEGDVVGLRGDISRLDSRMDGLESRMNRIEARMDSLESEMRAGFKSMDARFEQTHQTMATNVEVVLAAIRR